MKPDRWQRIDELFEAALERDSQDRAAFLDKACGDDQQLRREVEKMLRIDEQATEFIQTDAFAVAAKLITRSHEVSRGPEKQSRLTDSIDDARFIPGDVLSERYRIVGLLGQGGMGEVYRADDLKLKQPVALKFLPSSLTANGAALARFYKEVSVARQISHRHVCRVYDIGEYQGEHFISMEFVRGEELSSLLKRIGRLPQDKAIEVARQLCAGLAAVHERGVLHRDLKPANIMLDQHGDVRITDFGIAALADEIDRRDAMAGTPAYMSPEQLEGHELTPRSDIYSLGLVLYEVFTGKRAFEATTLQELISLRRSDSTPTSPAEIVPELDPLVERVIFRCLEREPAKRPASPLQIAAALPGGDPLAAALAAGETPSPEMVAAAPRTGGLRPGVALSLLAAVVIMIAAVSILSRYTALYRKVPLNKSPEVLRDRATELVRKFGYTATPADSTYGMGVDRAYLNHVLETDQSQSRCDKLSSGQPAAIYFWYRESPGPFVPSSSGIVTESEPARELPGMTTITLDTLGRLRSFYAVPPQKTAPPSQPTALPIAPDWSQLFNESGLDQTKFQTAPSIWTPPHQASDRAAWDGSYPDHPEMNIHIEAASFEGKPVYFEILDTWDQPREIRPTLSRFRQRMLIVLLLTVFIIVMLGSALLALRNLKIGRGDRKGAFRLAVFVLAVVFLNWLFARHHVLSEQEAFNFITGVKNMLFWTFFFWVVYLAFEPFVRRRWPGRIISWSRLLAGGFRDPLVGRDILIGATFGLGMIISHLYLMRLLPQSLGYLPDAPWFDFPATQLLGIRSFAHGFTEQLFAGLFQSFILLFVLLLFYIILRRERLAALALWSIMAVALSLTYETLAGVPFAMLTAMLAIWVLYRYGLLATISALFFLHLMIFYPITSEFSAWYAGDFVLILIVALALIGFSFYTSLAGQPLFRGSLPDD
ncbi:MAG TPA: serine/threonine-protein kinase [Pyrinomonadaceae bacterium]|nr:serine/threonine-protein kinase [Pyrinomonadaceae bacterium]